jgi:iron-sulfur cluster repair protein YtfE (RIC family)
MSDAVQLLEEQHALTAALFMKLERLRDPAVCEHIFRTIDVKLRDHTVIEEEIFYPAFRDRAKNTLGEDEVREALHEHGEVKSKLEEIEQISPTDYTFKSKIAELKALVEHHIQEEERGMLPMARRLFSEAELDELGFRMMKLMSLHSPIYEMVSTAPQTAARDTLRRVGDLVGKIGK